MVDDRGKHPAESGIADGFGPTSWTMVLAARDADMPRRTEALEQLCRTYWFPLYAFARRHGHGPQDSEDLTQSFFHHLLEKNFLGAVDRRKGKFRSFLLASMKYFMENEREFRGALKRGGGKTMLSLDECLEERFAAEPATTRPPELQFDRDWASALLKRARRRLRQEYERAGKSNLLQHLESFLTEESTLHDYKEVASRLNMSGNAVAIAVHRLRQRYRDVVREEILRTVSSPEEADREMSYLLEIVASSIG